VPNVGLVPPSDAMSHPVAASFHRSLPENPAVESALTGPLVRWFFNPAMTRRMHLNYVGTERSLGEPYALPGGDDLAGSPPTLMVDATNDRLRRSGQAFHREPVDVGVIAREVVVEAGHGFLGSPIMPAFSRGMAAIEEWLALYDTR
jgi:acetyl esterase/lipase